MYVCMDVINLLWDEGLWSGCGVPFFLHSCWLCWCAKYLASAVFAHLRRSLKYALIIASFLEITTGGNDKGLRV